MRWRRRQPKAGREDVELLFRTVLGRAPGEADVASGTTRTVAELLAELLASPERPQNVLTEADVDALYQGLLGRPAREPERELPLSGGFSAARLLHMILASDEHQAFAAREQARRTEHVRPNIYLPETAPYTHPVGTLSADGVAIVGQDGFCFIHAGSNAAVEHHIGRAELPDGWLDDWRELVATRRAQAAEAGVQAALVVVPDKLAVEESRFPVPLEPEGPRPIQRLLEAGLDLAYPLDELQALRPDREAYMRTDSHLTRHGNLVLHDVTCRAMGVEPADPFAEVDVHPYFAPGDLGVRFPPGIGELMHAASAAPGEIAEDNRAQISAGGGHIGTRRVWRNERAVHPDTVVVFGDSYSYGANAYFGLAWMLAQTFASVHFLWTPFGFDPDYMRDVGADHVVVQTAERFVVRVPHARVDVRDLERQALSRSVGLDPSAAFR